MLEAMPNSLLMLNKGEYNPSLWKVGFNVSSIWWSSHRSFQSMLVVFRGSDCRAMVLGGKPRNHGALVHPFDNPPKPMVLLVRSITTKRSHPSGTQK